MANNNNIISKSPFSPNTVVVQHPSGNGSCSHLFSSTEQYFLNNRCAFCVFLNSILSIFVGFGGFFSLSYLSDFVRIPKSLVETRWFYFIRDVFPNTNTNHFPYLFDFGSLPHFHGASVEASPPDSVGHPISFPSVNFTSSCISFREGYHNCTPVARSRLVDATSEGDSCQSITLGCTKCSSAAYLAGTGSLQFLFHILHYFSVVYNVQNDTYSMYNNLCKFSFVLSEEAVDFLYDYIPHIFSFTSKSVWEARRTASEQGISTATVFRFPRPRKSSESIELDLVDYLGFSPCVSESHEWYLSYPHAGLQMSFGPFSNFVDFFIFGSKLVKPAGHSLRLCDFARIPGFNCRINYQLASRILTRSNLESFINQQWMVDSPVKVLRGEAQGEGRARKKGRNVKSSKYLKKVKRTYERKLQERRDMTEVEKVARSRTEATLRHLDRCTEVLRKRIEKIRLAGKQPSEDRVILQLCGQAQMDHERYGDDEYDEYGVAYDDPYRIPHFGEPVESDEDAHVDLYGEYEEEDGGEEESVSEGSRAEEEEDVVPVMRVRTELLPLVTGVSEALGSVLEKHLEVNEAIHQYCELPVVRVHQQLKNLSAWLQGKEPEKPIEEVMRESLKMIGIYREHIYKLEKAVEVNSRVNADAWKSLNEKMEEIEKTLKALSRFATLSDENFERLNRLLETGTIEGRGRIDKDLDDMKKKVRELSRQVERKSGDFVTREDFDEMIDELASNYGHKLRDLKKDNERFKRELREKYEEFERRREGKTEYPEEPVREEPTVQKPRREPFIEGGPPMPKRDLVNPATLRGRREMMSPSKGAVPVPQEEEQGVKIKSADEVQLGRIFAENVPRDAVTVESAKDLMSAKYFIEQFKWEVGAASRVAFKTIRFPEVLFEKNDWIGAYYKLFQYFTCEALEFTITCTSNVFQGGWLSARWDPLSSANRQAITDAYSLSNLLGVDIQAGVTTTVILTVPFETIQQQLSLQGYEIGLLSLGDLVFYPLCGLVSPADTDSAAIIDVYSRFVNPHFKLRTTPHTFKRMKDSLVTPTTTTTTTTPTTSTTAQGVLGGIRKEENADEKVPRENLLHHCTWKAGEVGYVFCLNVHPCCCKKKETVMVASSLAVVSNLYHYWSGDLIYTIFFGCNSVTRGKLLLVSLPGACVTDDLTLSKAMNLDGKVIDMSEAERKIEIRVPYNGIAKMQRTQRYSAFDSMYYGEDLVTRLHAIIVDGLMTNVGAASSIEIAVTVKPAENFHLYHNCGLRIGKPLMSKAQGDTVGTDVSSGITTDGDAVKTGSSFGYLFQRKMGIEESLKIKVAPSWAKNYISQNPLALRSALHVRWKGSLVYKFQVVKHQKNVQKTIYFWHTPEDKETEELKAVKNLMPPTGARIDTWDVCNAEFHYVTVNFSSKFSSLLVPKSFYEDISHHPIFFYGGTLNMTVDTSEEFYLKCWIKPGADFEMMDCGPLPQVKEKGKSDMILGYFSKLKDVAETMKKSTEDLTVAKYLASGATSYDGRFEYLNYTGEAQMDNWLSRTAGNVSALSNLKLPGIVEKLNAVSELDLAGLKVLEKFDVGALNDLMTKCGPVLQCMSNNTEAITALLGDSGETAENMSIITKFGAGLTKLIMSAVKSSFPGWLWGMQENNEENTTVLVTTAIIVLCGVWFWWRKGDIGIFTGIGLVVATMWSPVIGLKALDLARWIGKNFVGMIVKMKRPTEEENSEERLNLDIADQGVAQMDIPFIGNEVFVSAAAGLGVILTSLFVMSKMPAEKEIVGFTERFIAMGNKARAFTSIGQMAEKLKVWSDLFVKMIMEWITGRQLAGEADSILNAAVKFDVTTWMARVVELNLEENKFAGVNCDDKVEEIRKLFDQGVALNTEICKIRGLSPAVVGVIRETFKKCESLVNETYTNRGLGLPRVDPIHICQIGRPGVGKSTSTAALAQHLGDSLGLPRKDRVYARSTADAFWSRYAGQPIVTYDDLGGITGDSSFSDYGEFINLKSNNPVSLNMAAVQEKGSVFRSKIIISNTNSAFLDNNTNVRDKDAFYRRRNLFVEVTRNDTAFNPEDPTQGLLYTVLDTFTGQVREQWDWFCAGFMEDGETFEVRPYADFAKFCAEYTRRYMENQEKLVRTLRGYEAEIIPEEETIETPLETVQRKREELEGIQFASIREFARQHNSVEAMIGAVKNMVTIAGIAQGDYVEMTDTVMSLTDLISCYNGLGITGDMIFKELDEHNVWIEELEDDPSTDLCVHLNIICHAGGILALEVLKKEKMSEILKCYRKSRVDQGKIIVTLKTLPETPLIWMLLFLTIEGLYTGCVKRCTCCSIQRRYAIASAVDDSEFFDAEEYTPFGPENKGIRREDKPEVVCFEWTGVKSIFLDACDKFGKVAVTDGKNIWVVAETEMEANMAEAKFMTRMLGSVNNLRDYSRMLTGSSASDLAELEAIITFYNREGHRVEELNKQDWWMDFVDRCGNKALPLIALLMCTAKDAALRKEARALERKIKKVEALKKLKVKQEGFLKRAYDGCSAWMKKLLKIGGIILGGAAIAGVICAIVNFFKGDSSDNEAQAAFGKSGDDMTKYPQKSIVQRSMAPRLMKQGPHNSGDERTDYPRRTIVERSDPPLNSYLGFKQGEGSLITGAEIVGSQKKIADMAATWQEKMWEQRKVAEESEYPENEIVGSEEKANFTVVRVKGAYLLETKSDLVSGDVLENEKLVEKRARNVKVAQMTKKFLEDKAALEEIVKEEEKLLCPGAKEMIEIGPMMSALIGEPQAADRKLQEMIPKFQNNCAQMYFVEEKVYVSVLCLVAGWIVMPAHYMVVLRHGSPLVFVSRTQVLRLSLDRSKIHFLNGMQDLVMMDLGPRKERSPSIVKHLISVKEMMQYRAAPGMCISVAASKHGTINYVEHLGEVKEIAANTTYPTISYEHGEGRKHALSSGFKYPIASVTGSCGSVILSRNPKLNSKILGIHVAAAVDYCIGYCEALVRENVVEVLNKHGIGIEGVAQSSQVEYKGELLREPRLPVVKMLSPAEKPKMTGVTTIKKSKIHGLIGKVETEPSVLGPYDRRVAGKKAEVLLDAVEKYAEKVKEFDPIAIKRVEDFLIQHVKNFKCDRKQVLTEEEMINGIPGTDALPMQMDTSPGYPYVLTRLPGQKGKKYLFEEAGTYENGQVKYVPKSKHLKVKLNVRDKMAREGRMLEAISVEHVKDERRKLSKIYDKPATRSFSCLPVDCNLLYRKYFLDFAVAVQKNRHESFTKVGTNVDSMDWTIMMERFLEKSDVGFAGDYAKFDGIGPPELYESVTNVVNAWYDDSEEDKRARHTLIAQCFHRRALVKDCIVQIDQGLPSGFALTVIYNSFVNFYFLAMAWMDIVGSTDLWVHDSPEQFLKFCEVAVYGDDNVVSVNKEFVSVYNLQSVSLWLSQYGVTYTDDQKRPIVESDPVVDIRSVTFLKRSFVHNHSDFFWTAPLNKVSVEEQCHWIRECDDEDAALDDNVRNALYEACKHGKDYWEDLKSRLELAYSAVFRVCPVVSWREQMIRWWGGLLENQVSSSTIGALLESGDLGPVMDLKQRMLFPIGDNVTLQELILACRSGKPLPLDVKIESTIGSDCKNTPSPNGGEIVGGRGWLKSAPVVIA
ncbi:TPA_asm: polyprotein [Ficus hirta waikavirus]|uniref:Polyprotein n=1 Tax=Ficus hirta waikavirus TaxID=3027340 RepID=A0AA48SGH3_9SECO|nr:TPA_asm: polyprotein [Ficus hirta waikavirus]